MPNRKEHISAGGLVGGVAAGFMARDEPVMVLLIEVAAGYCSGRILARLPDIFDPPLSPNHRSLAHGVVPAGGTLTWVFNELPGWQRSLRDKASECETRFKETDNLIDIMSAIACWALSGALAGSLAGYSSHLIMDAGTSKGLPAVS